MIMLSHIIHSLPISHSALHKKKEKKGKKKKKTFVWVLHGHQATLHTTFVDMCMHVHVSCQPVSHQVLMRPAGSVLGPNQTGETAQSWLSFRLVHPTSPKPPAHPPSPPDILENHGRLSTHGRFGIAVCLLKSTLSPRSLGQGLN